MHVHVYSGDGEAKFWMEPKIELAQNYGLADRDLARARRIIEERVDDIRAAWQRHFGR